MEKLQLGNVFICHGGKTHLSRKDGTNHANNLSRRDLEQSVNSYK